MPRVLMLARHFPPIGGAGVHRTLGSVRHLPALRLRAGGRHRGRPPSRPLGAARRGAAGPPRSRLPHPSGGRPQDAGPSTRLERLSGRPPLWVRSWVEAAARLGTEVGGGRRRRATRPAFRTRRPSPPHASAHALGLPWVADLEDPWALDEMRLALSGAHRALDLRRMRRALSHGVGGDHGRARGRRPGCAPRCPSWPSACRSRASRSASSRPTSPSRRSARGDGSFRIVHTGSMHTDLGRAPAAHAAAAATAGRESRRASTSLTRSHVFLVEAIARAIAADPSLEGRIELHLAGAAHGRGPRGRRPPRLRARARAARRTGRRWR